MRPSRRTPASDPAAGPAPAGGARPQPTPARCPEPGHRAHVRGGPLRVRGRRRDANPERAPDLASGWPWAAHCGAELVVGFASQLGELNLGFTQLAALYVLAEGATTTVADLADAIGRSPSATSRLVDGLVKRRLVERRREEDDGRLRSVWLTARGRAILRMVDRARAEQFLSPCGRCRAASGR